MESMTGFAVAEGYLGNSKIKIELKSVNHRFLEVKARLPKELSLLEINMVKKLSEHFKRGHIDINIKRTDLPEGQMDKLLNKEKLKIISDKLKSLASDLKISNEITMDTVISVSERMKAEEEEESLEKTWKELSPILEKGIISLKEMRRKEGDYLKTEMTNYLAKLRQIRQDISTLRDGALAEFESNLKAKLSKILEPSNIIDPSRLAQEVAIVVDKSDIAEELSRLQSHYIQFEKLISETKEPPGKKLDFLFQEMNREANTIASKTQNPTITKETIELKHTIEKSREQAQNIE